MLRQVLTGRTLFTLQKYGTLSYERMYHTVSRRTGVSVPRILHAKHANGANGSKAIVNILMTKRYNASAASAAEATLETQESMIESTDSNVSTPKRFEDVEAVSKMLKKALDKVFKYKEMSKVQEEVLTRLPSEEDMFVKAKTGTGKTLAFLIGAMETATRGQSLQDLKFHSGTRIFIISPTRELAVQIADEAQKLVSFYPFKVACLVGGESRRKQVEDLRRSRADIVVGTPGRLLDLLSSERRFRELCENVKVLVLDEADHLLDMGFKNELNDIIEKLPKKRQTMLFSATLNDEIKRNLGNVALSSQHILLDTVGADEVNTHLHVKQSALVAPFASQLHLLTDMLNKYPAALNGKVMIFMPTTKSTALYSSLLQRLLPHRLIFELHSGKSQDRRRSIANRFRKAPNGILVTSDVSARGVDYPGVSLVVQVGVPTSREQYIHRLGRTGRAGRDGEGILVMAPFEQPFLKRVVGDLPIETLQAPEQDSEHLSKVDHIVKSTIESIDQEAIREVYTAFLGYYVSRTGDTGINRTEVIDHANDFLTSLGVKDMPYLSPRFVQQLGLDKSQRRSGGSQSYGNGRRDSYRRGSFSDSFSERRSSSPRRPSRSLSDNDERSDMGFDLLTENKFNRRPSRSGFEGRNRSEHRGKYENRDSRDRFGSRDKFDSRDRRSNWRDRFSNRDEMA